MSGYPKIYIAGHRGMVGAAIMRELLLRGHPPDQIITRNRAELNLTDQGAVRAFHPNVLIKSTSVLLKWVVFTPTVPIQLNLSTKTL